MTLSIPFSGWYQVRLATDNDRYDDPRGGSQGWVFALEGEPDLDRIIRFQPAGTFMRRHISPNLTVGVSGGPAVTDDPDLDAGGLSECLVDLLGNPVFEGRNNLIAPPAREPIWPLHPSVTGTGWRLSRPFADEMDQDRPPHNSFVPAAEGRQVAAQLLEKYGMPVGNEATAAFRTAANARLSEAAAAATDPVEKANLQARAGRIVLMNGVAVQWRAELTGTATVEAPAGQADRLDRTSPWFLEMLSTGFSSDSMCALVTGWLHIPSTGEVVDEEDWKLPGPAPQP